MLKKTLASLNLTEQENNKLGFPTFENYYYNFSNADLRGMDLKKREIAGKKTKKPNLKINYCDQNGKPFFYRPNNRKQSETYVRLRFADCNRYPIKDKSGALTGKISPKYKSSKNTINYPFFNGLHLFPSKNRNHIWLVEGEKKAIAGCKIGLPMIGLSGIHAGVKAIKEHLTEIQKYNNIHPKTIDAEFIQPLKSYIQSNQIETINLLFDNDCFKNKFHPSRAISFFSAIRNQFYACQNLGVNLVFWYITDDSEDAKGLDDLIQKNNFDKSIPLDLKKYELYNWQELEKLEFTFASSTISDEVVFLPDIAEYYQFTQGTRLSEKVKPKDLLYYNNIIPTGTGKTYTTALINDLVIIATPTKALAANVEGEYNAIKYTAQSKDKIIDSLKDCAAKKLLISVTYDSLPALADLIEANENETGLHVNDFNLVVDEAHNFTAASNRAFRANAMINLVDQIDRFKSFSMLSGTFIPCFHPVLNKYPIRKIKIELDQIQAQIRPAADTIKSAALLIQESINKGRFPVVLFNNKSGDGALGTLKTYLNDLPGVRFFNSTTKQNLDWKKLTSEGIINEGVKGIITTTVLKEGNNILNNLNYDFILIGSYHSSEWAQFVRRARNPKSVKINWIISKNKINNDLPYMGFYKTAVQKIYTYSGIIKTLNNSLVSNVYIDIERVARSIIDGTPIRFNKDKNEFFIDWLVLSNMVYEDEKVQENNNFKALIKNLLNYNITLNWGPEINIKKTKKEQIEAKAFRQIKREVKEGEYIESLDEIREFKNPYLYAIRELNTDGKDLPEGKRMALQRINLIQNYFENPLNAIDFLKEIGVKETDFKRVKNQILFKSLYQSEKYMNSGNDFTLFLKSIKTEFKFNKKYSGEDILNIFLDCAGLDKSISTEIFKGVRSEYNVRNAIKKLRYFYQVEKVRSIENGERIYKYIFSELPEVYGLTYAIDFDELQKQVDDNKKPIDCPF